MATTEHTGSGDLSRSMALLWGTGERSQRGPKPGLSVTAVVQAAVELADEEGLAALSMRKVAARLGVGTMSLYRYVPGKGELLDLMLDHVQGPLDHVPEGFGTDWRITLEAVARGSWHLYTTHPWLLQINQTRPVLGPNSMASFDMALAGLDGIGLSGKEKATVLVAVDNYVTGTARMAVLAQQSAAETGVSDEDFWAAQYPYIEKAMNRGDYPQIAALPADTFTSEGPDILEFGLKPLLDGLELMINARRPPGD
ncbi:TetR/AcrR family transcriptional regulator [Streptomyces sp. TRM 70351]|uniref:TetR/AcrR family transcriptional regulator n=1 Tax=Streptomyces sp. TRM 70351 TaxID=3116552 RepID=UPI002E7B9660|nr:TetR/AcrR family transcriptional regulator [Streptomyces sp. TRM 70351]MEE1929613.1 TetR/AcrR family transcriptional regulator [Streptomyces sp. TRM 70351]